jgi:hypothetical protein
MSRNTMPSSNDFSSEFKDSSPILHKIEPGVFRHAGEKRLSLPIARHRWLESHHSIGVVTMAAKLD